ncbi:MAG: GNAT family N-acetyltransferase [Clostridia bacterium]
MEIVKYKSEYKNDFIRLSKNWITKYFALESDDFEVFENIDKLIKNGAMIYFAIENGVVYATCMAQPMTNNEWEICKLAADERYEEHGAGSAVFKACMDYALENGANKLTILSNSILKPALHIYEKYGFYEIPVDNTHHYKRVDIQFEYTAK